MTTAIDTNVLIDLLIPNSQHNLYSRAALAAVNREGGLVVSEPVVAELGGFFREYASLQRFVDETRLRLQTSSPEVLITAGVAWREYSRRRGATITCPACGTAHRLTCSSCGRDLSFRQHLLADFMIGAHAQVHADQLLTRDQAFYRTYFPDLRLA